MRPLFLRLVPVLSFALLACAPGLHAQEAPSPDAPPPASTAPAQQEQNPETQTLKVNVNLVDLYFSVRDKSGYVTGLHQQDCGLWEDGQQQTIKNFTQEKNLPLTIGILLDTSGSQKNVLPLEQDSGARFLSEVLKPKDEAFLISFDVNVDLLSDYTNSAHELKRAIDKASINAASSSAGVPGIGGGPFPTSHPRGTLLYDAVYLAAHDKLQSQTGRKILVLLTDGGDQGSQETLKSATEAAQKANAIVYPILIADREQYLAYGFGINLADTGERDMQKMATDTGGRVINVGNNGKKLQEAFDQIQDELRTQYLASFTPTNTKIDGTFRTLNITCQPGQKIQARKGSSALADAQGKDD